MLVDFSTLHILVVGDVMLDEYIMTRVQRISPEAPIPVAKVYDKHYVAGGAANVARNLAQLGCKVSLIGVKGQDAAGEKISAVLQEEGIHDEVRAFSGVVSIQKTRVMAQRQQMMRIDSEADYLLSTTQHQELLDAAQRLVSSCQAVILSDYAKGVLSSTVQGKNLAKYIIEQGKKLNIPIFVDPKGTDWSNYKGASCITPNASECGLMIGYDCSREEDLERAGKAIIQELGIEKLLVTRSEKGMALCSQAEAPFYVKSNAKEVIDVSGAGDTSIAVLTACYAMGFGWQQSVQLANKAAGKVVIKSGTAPITKDEFYSLLYSHGEHPKILSLEACLPLVRLWREQGKSIVFTNGCFDLLHKGHLHILAESASLGKRLIVGLNSDSSVKLLKGSSRPIQDEETRALLLANMQHVDAVVVFNEETPQKLIEAIVPDVLVKGGDYNAESIVGADIVSHHGGKVHVVPLLDGFSTTKTIESVMKNSTEK